ncbi:MAG TPA: PEP-CTERM sorting domain-containing protein, partial [Anaerohalosphaeraceae bacterium]|nr:PEP-CTERM sorting domain-containing protein [Anaerohalosphaeraceae bacterium]
MMKKLLTLILVLGLVPMASAGFMLSGQQQVDVSIDPVNGITLHSLDAVSTPWYAYVIPTDLPLVYEFHQFGDKNKAEPLGIVPGAEVGLSDPAAYVMEFVVASTTVGFLHPGPYWTARLGIDGVVYQAEAPADPANLVGRIMLADYNTAEVFATAYAVIPEPATMLLLGLGGLFLRRK